MSDPAAPAPEAPVDFSSSLSAAMDAHNATVAAPEAPASPAAPAKPGKEKPAAPAAAEPVAPKKPWETKIDEPQAEEPEQQPEEETSTEDPPAGLDEKAKVPWGNLRKTEKAYKEILPKFQAMERELAELKATPSKIPAEIEQELTELRQLRAAHDVESTPEWKESILKPWEQHSQRLKDVADFAKVDVASLMAVIDEPNRLQRNRLVREILGKSTEELNETDINEAVSAINDLIPVDAKARDLKQKALEIKDGLQGREKAQSEQQKLEAQQKLDQASGEMLTHFQASLAAAKLFDNKELFDAVKSARPADPKESPMDAAYQAMAGATLPAVIEAWNNDKKERARLEKIVTARGKASPATEGAASPGSTTKPEEGDGMEQLEGLIKSHIGR